MYQVKMVPMYFMRGKSLRCDSRRHTSSVDFIRSRFRRSVEQGRNFMVSGKLVGATRICNRSDCDGSARSIEF